MSVDFNLFGRRALVTGAGGGLGAAIADGLAELGAEVVATSRDAVTARRLAKRYDTQPCVLDVLDTASLPEVVARVWTDGPCDILVNNAGVNRPRSLLEVDEVEWDEVLDTNLKGVFFLSQAVARRMVASHLEGSIINIGSQAGSVALEERAAYCASKGGLEQLTKVFAIELAPHGIRVNAVAPTFVRTEMTRSTLDRDDMRDRFLSRLPLGRFAEPTDVAGSVAFLAGGTAGMVTGHTLRVDGGWTAW